MNSQKRQAQQAPDTEFGRKGAVYQNGGGWEGRGRKKNGLRAL